MNTRTGCHSSFIPTVQGASCHKATKEDVQEALRRLSEQESRVYKVTRDLELGKNE